MLGSKESSKTLFYPAAVFHSRTVDVPAEKFQQPLLLSNVIFLPSEQSLQCVYIFVCPYRGIPLTVQNFRTQTNRHPRLYPFSSFPLRWNKTHYNIDHTHPHVALYCTETATAVSLFRCFWPQSDVQSLRFAGDCWQVLTRV
jgi:hypothetical protein